MAQKGAARRNDIVTGVILGLYWTSLHTSNPGFRL